MALFKVCLTNPIFRVTQFYDQAHFTQIIIIIKFNEENYLISANKLLNFISYYTNANERNKCIVKERTLVEIVFEYYFPEIIF
jgi:hypothetical protein